MTLALGLLVFRFGDRVVERYDAPLPKPISRSNVLSPTAPREDSGGFHLPVTCTGTPGTGHVDSRCALPGSAWAGRRRSGSGLSFGFIHPRTEPFTGDRGPHIRAGRDADERW